MSGQCGTVCLTPANRFFARSALAASAAMLGWLVVERLKSGHATTLGAASGAVAGLVAEFNAYLDRAGADPTADSVGYRQIPLWLSRDELAELVGEVRSVIASRMDNEPAADRRLHLLSPILFPIEGPPQP